VEDDDAMRLSLAQTLELEGATVIQVSNLQHAKRHIRFNFAGIVLSDIRMPLHDGFDVLDHVQTIDPDLPVVMLTGEADVPMALRALKSGAYDFLEKPCPTDRLVEVLNRALAHRALVTKNRLADHRLKRLDAAAQNFPGECLAIREFRDNLRAYAADGCDVHIWGAEGSGKRLAAYTLHSISLGRKTNVAINLRTHRGALAAQLHDVQDALDLTIKNLDQASEEQLAEIKNFREQRSNVRLITTSLLGWSVDGEACGLATQFLGAPPAHLRVPDLEERREDLPVIFEAVLRAYARTMNLDAPQVNADTLDQIVRKDWVGNLAELRSYANEFMRALDAQTASNTDKTLAERMDTYEAKVLVETLETHVGNVAEAAHALGLPHKTLYDRLARHGIKPKTFKKSPSV
ncbi:MAG: response regulator, partial [Pseudomonadota bacterium]